VEDCPRTPKACLLGVGPTLLGVAAGLFLLISSAASAAEERDALDEWFDRVWGYATLYDEPESRVLQRLAFVGRLQVDGLVVDSNRGNYDDLLVRRLRLGAQSRWFDDFVLHVEGDIDVDCNRGEDCKQDEYEGLTDAYLGWDRYDAFRLEVGKISAPFTLDGATSSKRLITLERNNVSQNLWFPAEYHTGGAADGQLGKFSYRVGAFSSSTDEEFGSFEGGFFTLYSVAYDFSESVGVEEFEVALDYVYNDRDQDNIATRALSHVLSLRARFDTGTWGIRSDLSGGLGYGSQEDLFGLVVVPFYHLTRHFQVVGRYTHLRSSGRDGVQFARYDDRVDDERGGQYDEFFLGLNWFLYGERLKLQTGIKYALMTERPRSVGTYRGFGFTTGLRLGW
jgi:phosphate-selective porin OprO/OprP